MLEREFWSPNRRESGRVTLKMGPWDPPFTRQEGRNAPELGRSQNEGIPEGMTSSIQKELLAELADRLSDVEADAETLSDLDTGTLINVVLSFLLRQPVGSAQKNLTEVINTFLSSDRRHRFARLMQKVISVTSGPEFLEVKSVANKFYSARQSDQDGPESVIGKVALLLFPDLFDKHPASANQLIDTPTAASARRAS